MKKEDSAFTIFERQVRAKLCCQSAHPEGTVTQNHGSTQLNSEVPFTSTPWFTDRLHPRNEIWNRDSPSQNSRLSSVGPLQGGVSLASNELAYSQISSISANQSLQTQSIKLEKTIASASQGHCSTSSGSMLPPIYFLHSLLRHADAPISSFSEHMERSPCWIKPLNDMRHSVIASDHSSDPPPSRSYPHTQIGAPPQGTATRDQKSCWRRAPKRWGLAEWERDDSGARERRREQNREAQRRFRDKRRRAHSAAAAVADFPSPAK